MCDDSECSRMEENFNDLTAENSTLIGDLSAAEERIEALSDLVKETVDERDEWHEAADKATSAVERMMYAAEAMQDEVGEAWLTLQ